MQRAPHTALQRGIDHLVLADAGNAAEGFADDGRGIVVVVAGQVSGVDTMAISQMVGRTLPFVSVAIPFYLVILMAGFRRGLQVWPAALVSSDGWVTPPLTAWRRTVPPVAPRRTHPGS